jgi:putative GTP pyrophosphokinase
MSKRGSIRKQARENIDGFVRQYELKRPLYLEFTEKLRGLLEDILNSAKIKYQVVECRTKDVESFREKITRANKQYSDPMQQITDLTGLRIIVYYLEDVDLVGHLIENEFTIDKDASVDKGQLLQPTEFGYRSVHYIVSLSGTRNNLLEWHSHKGLVAEIQVRTVLQHAWAAISHALQYKREEDVPSLFRRRLSRLSGLLELSDEEFSALRKEQQDLTATVSAKIVEGNILLELNAITVSEYLKESGPMKSIVATAKKLGFSFEIPAGLEVSIANQVSKLIALSNLFGISTIEALDIDLAKSKLWAEKYLRHLKDESPGIWIVDSAFLAQLILLRVHKEKSSVEILLSQGWDKGTAQRVIKAAKIRS